MPDNWINRRLLTDEIEIDIDGVKVHDLLDCSYEDQAEVLESNYPTAFSKLTKVDEKAYVPYIPTPEGSTVGYKIIVDAYTPTIGDIVRSSSDKYTEVGVSVFDQLLADGSEVFESEHPVYWETLVAQPYVIDISDEVNGNVRGLFWDGEYYWVCTTDFMVYQLDTDFTNQGSFSVVYDDNANYGFPQGLVIVDDYVYTIHTAGSFSDTLRKYTKEGLLESFIPLTFIENPLDLAYREDTGNLYITDSNLQEIIEITLDGVFVSSTTVSNPYSGLGYESGSFYGTYGTNIYKISEDFLEEILYLETDTVNVAVTLVNGFLLYSAGGTTPLLYSNKGGIRLRPDIEGSEYRVIADLTT